MQVVVSVDFYQLPPMPNYDDEGGLAFLSSIWKGVFPYTHSFILEKIALQKEPDFIAFVNEIRKGFFQPRWNCLLPSTWKTLRSSKVWFKLINEDIFHQRQS